MLPSADSCCGRVGDHGTFLPFMIELSSVTLPCRSGLDWAFQVRNHYTILRDGYLPVHIEFHENGGINLNCITHTIMTSAKISSCAKKSRSATLNRLQRNGKGVKQENRSNERFEATAGFEPAIRVLQTPALPLGYVAAQLAGINSQRIVSALYCFVKSGRSELSSVCFLRTVFYTWTYLVMTLTDEMVVCERCGVTFLWTLEDRRKEPRAQKPPTSCFGCSFLLPPSQRERGLVKWYSPGKKYGFISRSSGPDLFTHRSRFDGVGRLRTGDLVEFEVEETEKGAAAVDVRLLSRLLKDGSRDHILEG